MLFKNIVVLTIALQFQVITRIFEQFLQSLDSLGTKIDLESSDEPKKEWDSILPRCFWDQSCHSRGRRFSDRASAGGIGRKLISVSYQMQKFSCLSSKGCTLTCLLPHLPWAYRPGKSRDSGRTTGRTRMVRVVRGPYRFKAFKEAPLNFPSIYLIRVTYEECIWVRFEI